MFFPAQPALMIAPGEPFPIRGGAVSFSNKFIRARSLRPRLSLRQRGQKPGGLAIADRRQLYPSLLSTLRFNFREECLQPSGSRPWPPADNFNVGGLYGRAAASHPEKIPLSSLLIDHLLHDVFA